MNKPQYFYHELNDNKIDTNILDINKVDKIITQNENNLYVYNSFSKINNDKQIIICELPDYKDTQELIKTDNNQIIIGIIGAISEIKGKVLVYNLIKYFKSNTNIKIIIFGVLNIEYEYKYEYSNINELNDLLIKYKPNLIIETSLWTESYSYTLTISMITQLPILYLKKPFHSVIENRLQNYSKAYSYQTLIELETLINNVKQDYFYTIKPILYFNKFWDDYFINKNSQIKNNFKNDGKDKNIYKKNIILVTSKIYVTNNAFSYINTRSIYTKQERFLQTTETINSIRKYIPDSYIYLVDNSDFNNYEYEILNSLVDHFINITNDPELNYFTNECKYKAFADIYHQYYFLNSFLKNPSNKSILNFFKLTGRYLINETFNYENYNNNDTIFKQNNAVTNKKYYYTCFFKLSKHILSEYHEKIKKLVDNKYLYFNDSSDCEVILPNTIIDKIKLVDHLGITQRIAVWNTIENI